MTIDEGITLLRAMIPDFVSTVHNEADLIDLLEQGANEVAALTLCYERKTTFTDADSPQVFVVGQREYLINFAKDQGQLGLVDSIKILSVHLDGFPLTQITPEGYTAAQLGGTAQGIPAFWYEFAGRLGFRPTPSSLPGGFTLEVTYAARIGEWVGGECVLPAAFDDLILRYAYVKALMREGQWEDALSAFITWLKDVQMQPVVVQRPATQKSGPPMPPTQARDQQRQRR